MLLRCKQLDSWTQDLALPTVVWLSGLFNPQSFLTGNIHAHPPTHLQTTYPTNLCCNCQLPLGILCSVELFAQLPSLPPAVMQSLARKNEWPLDKMNLTVDVTKKFKEEFNQPAREGAYVYGLYMEGIHSSPSHEHIHPSSCIFIFPSLSHRCKMGHSGWGDH